MILDLELQRDKRGKITAKESDYRPDERTQDRTMSVLKDFQLSREIMDTPYEEFNNKSLIQRMNTDQRAFNSFQPPKSADPDFEWQSNAIRPVTRNKVISIAAHVSGRVMIPQVFAQNERDEEDQNASVVMRDLLTYTLEESDYDRTFLYSVISALVNPATVVHTEFADVKRKIKEITSKDRWTEKEVRDELFSGFKNALVPLDELYINNIYEHDIQRQGYLIWRRAIDYTIAETKYGHLANFKFVTPGIQILFDDNEATFYEQYDDSLQERLVEEIIYYNRYEDLQLVFLNGVLVTDPDQPNPRKDKSYPFSKFGFEPIDEGRFFYYKSLVSKLSADQDVIDTLYRMVIDGSLLQTMPPTAVYGDEVITSSVTIPGSVTPLNAETKLEQLNVGGNLNAGFNALAKVEGSLAESSLDVRSQGMSEGGQQTAREVMILEQNARTVLGLFGKMIGFFVKDFGKLRINDILQFMTVAEAGKLSPENRVKRFTLPDKVKDGRTVAERIEFDFSLEDEMTRGQMEAMSREIAKQEKDQKVKIMKVNPKLFRKMKFMVKVSPDMAIPLSDNIQRALNLEVFDRAIQMPMADQEALYREMLLGSYPQTKDDPDRFIKKVAPMPPQGLPGGMSPGLDNIVGSPKEPNLTEQI